MRVKRQKRFRKAVRFYKACFGFREPFKVLCDGNFQHFVLQKGFGDLQKLLSQALGGAAKPFTTRCINAELKRLGFSETLLASRKLLVAKCDHEPVKPGCDCLESLVSNYNPEHFFVASQDVELRRKLRIMPGCAIIFSQKLSLVVEPPSEFQQQFARADEEKREHMKEQEQKRLEGLQIKPAETENGPEQELPKKRKKDPNLVIKDRPTFKRKRAKGPNPLSCKKSQKKLAPQASDKHAKKKTRHRSRKQRKEGQAEAQTAGESA